MDMRNAVIGVLLALLGGAGALAQETPEAAYAQLHAATLAGKVDAALEAVAKPLRAELTAKPQAERDGLFRSLAQAMPRTYRVTEKSVDGDAARLVATGISEFQGGRTEAWLTARLAKEGEVWRVASWTWSSQKPAAPAPKPAAPEVAAPAAALPVQESRIVRRTPGTDPNAPAAPATAVAVTPAAAPASRPSRAHRDARDCLKLPTDSAIRACAEKYR